MDNNNLCVLCGGRIELRRTTNEVSIAGRRTPVEVEGYRCNACGEVFLTPQQADDAQRRAAAVLRRQEGLLTPAEILEIRTRLGLTQAGLERLLGVGPKTVVRWERGTVFQSPPADRLLRVLSVAPEMVRLLTQEALDLVPEDRPKLASGV